MKKLFASLVALLFIGSASAVRAQDQDQQQPPQQEQQQDPQQQDSQQPAENAPGVARVSLMSGNVSSQRGDNGDWVAVTVNTPLSVGDRISTGQNSRAAIQLDYADILRLSDNSTAKIAALDRSQIQVQIGQGLVTYSVLKGSSASAEIDTPNVAIHPDGGQGQFRILVNSDQETQVTVRDGQAEITTPQGSTKVQKGDLITIAGTADSAQYKVTDAPGKDDWDRFNDDRNKNIERAASWQHTDRYYTGSEDLDPYGTWSEVPDYGQVWVPAQNPGWAPYRDGRWVYEPYYGWTWTSYEPWGWAPYHYGRWFVYGGNWAWWPGPVAAYPGYYPVWSPAYVSFFGWGRGGFGIGFGFGFGFGNIGWLPVGPCDFYHPWYGGYGRFGNRVNVVNVTNIRNVNIRNIHNGIAPLAGNRGGRQFSNINRMLVDPRVRSGLSSMNSKQFGQARVSMHQQAIGEATLRNASMATGRMRAATTRASFNPSGRAASASTIRNTQSHFFTAARANSPASAQAARTGLNSPARTNNVARSGSATAPNRAVSARSGSSTFQRPASRTTTQDRGIEHPASKAFNQRLGNLSEPAQSNASQGWHTFGSGSAANTSSRPGVSRVPATGSQSRTFQPPQAARGASPNGAANTRTFTPSNSRTNQSPAANQRSGWQHFTPPSHTTAPQNSRGFSPSGGSQRTFTPPNRPYSPQSGRSFSPPSQARGSQRTFTPPSSPSRGSSSYGYSRPPLNMRQPIMTPRSNGGYGYSAPRGNPGYSAPRGNSGYRPPSGGAYRAPSGGGYRAPAGGGYRAPSGGGNRGGGGGNHGGGGSHGSGGHP
ncbi:MAG: DUF6600 domain-containing protein [Candidatus Acidiferrales bacterium]